MVKRGLGESYSKTIIPEKTRAYLDLSKPASSIGIMLTIPFASIIYASLNGLVVSEFLIREWTTITYASVTMFLLHSASQSMNMAEDAHMDKKTEHKQNRPIPSGVVTKEEARTIAWIFMLFGISRAFTITPWFGVYSVILSFFGIAYNLPPLRVKEVLWVNLIWQAVSRGLLLYPATFAVWGDPFNVVAWTMGVASFLLVLSLQNTADFADVEIDEEFDIITPAVHHGLNQLTMIMSGIVLIMFGFITICIELSILPNFWSLYILTIPIGWVMISLWREPKSISSMSGNHFSWFVYYFSLASMYILPAIQLSVF